MNDAPPYFVKTRDCMDRPNACWIQDLVCSDGTIVTAWGSSAKAAITNANLRRNEQERFLGIDPRQQIKEILAKGQDYPCAQDQGTLNRAFAKLLGCI